MRRLLIPALVLALAAAAGCSGRTKSADTSSPSTTGAADTATADFGTLKSVCGKGTAKTVTSQGVTASDIKVGVFSDVGFTKNPEFENAAKVFTSWCNAAAWDQRTQDHTRDARRPAHAGQPADDLGLPHRLLRGRRRRRPRRPRRQVPAEVPAPRVPGAGHLRDRCGPPGHGHGRLDRLFALQPATTPGC